MMQNEQNSKDSNDSNGMRRSKVSNACYSKQKKDFYWSRIIKFHVWRGAWENYDQHAFCCSFWIIHLFWGEEGRENLNDFVLERNTQVELKIINKEQGGERKFKWLCFK